MLGGIDPIIIFNFKQNLAGSDSEKIPLPPSSGISIPLPAIPIYLSETLSGVYIESEDKSIDIDTSTIPTVTGTDEKTDQRVINSSVKINMVAKQSSLGAALFVSMSDLIIPKISSKEYSITYLHGTVLVFNGLLRSFSIQQQAGTDLYNISMELVKPGSSQKQSQPNVQNDPKAATISDALTKVKR